VKKLRSLFLLTIATLLPAGSIAEELTLPQAITAQRALIETRSNDASLHNDLGNLLLLVGDEAEAENAYHQALFLEPELVSAHFNLGLLYQHTSRHKKARREFDQAIVLQPEHAWSHYQIGVLNALQGRRKAAINSYARALRLDPRLTDPAFNPHILDNNLAASATLAAYADVSSADLVPRTYESPRRIAGLLVPLPPAAAAELQQKVEEDAATPERDLADGYEDEPEPVPPAEASPTDTNEARPTSQEPLKRKRPKRPGRKQKQ
jgi:tetratricopeptide (TPR) repeat protein